LTRDYSGGFMNPLYSPRYEHSKTGFGNKNPERKFGDSETFSESKLKFYPATGVNPILGKIEPD